MFIHVFNLWCYAWDIYISYIYIEVVRLGLERSVGEAFMFSSFLISCARLVSSSTWSVWSSLVDQSEYREWNLLKMYVWWINVVCRCTLSMIGQHESQMFAFVWWRHCRSKRISIGLVYLCCADMSHLLMWMGMKHIMFICVKSKLKLFRLIIYLVLSFKCTFRYDLLLI